MKAALVTRYGPPEVVTVGEAPKPVPGPGELLVRVHAATVNRTDCGELRPHPQLGRLVFGLIRPRRRIFGMDFAGTVEAVGEGVTAFTPGDRVFGMCPARRNGAQADYVCLPKTAPIAALPEGVPFAGGVVCEGAYYANSSLKRYLTEPGRDVLVYGASGAIGSAAVQLARHYGANVTAAVETRHLAMAGSLGADRVVTTAELGRLGPSFDLVLDAVGKMSRRQWRPLLKPDGAFATTDIGPWGQNLLWILWARLRGDKNVSVPLPERGGALAFVGLLARLLEAGRYRAIVDRTYKLDDIAEAYRYVESGRKAGIVVIDVAGDG
ncbi:MAG TPA: NAD(P)-dependent alcohol dehydrogenase [Allosphingosinicella sp.]|nr:NAD(P)-dependent alcohol dehydrogenase [Allosphingosinicella sp.]